MTFISDSEADALSALLSRRSILGATAAAGGLLATPLSAFAQGTAAGGAGEAEITVDQARQAPIPIVIPSFGAGMGEQISSVISSDLAGTGLFKVMTGDVSPSGTPDFSALKAQGARAAVAGRAVGSGSVRVEMRLWNVVAGEQLQGTAYTASPSNWRRIAHIIADVIYERMLGEKGYFDTRIAYIARTGPRRHQITRLALMDQDGFNSRMLTGGQWLTLTPRFNRRAIRLRSCRMRTTVRACICLIWALAVSRCWVSLTAFPSRRASLRMEAALFCLQRVVVDLTSLLWIWLLAASIRSPALVVRLIPARASARMAARSCSTPIVVAARSFTSWVHRAVVRAGFPMALASMDLRSGHLVAI